MISAAAVTLASEIRAVTVFRRGALVTRSAEIPTHGGVLPSEVRIEGLPLALDDASVRVSVESETQGPRAADLRLGLDVVAADEKPGPTRDEELRAAMRAEAAARSELARLEKQLQLLHELVPKKRPPPARGELPPLSPVEARLELVRFRASRGAALAEARTSAQRELEARIEARELLEAEQAQASTERPPEIHELRKTAIVRLEPPQGSEERPPARLVLSYAVIGARWAPSYTLRLDANLRSAEIELRAVVRQLSGEDWSQVKLTVSTASPEHWSELPKLEALRIGRAQPRPRPTWRPPPSGTEALYQSYDARNPARGIALTLLGASAEDELMVGGGGFDVEVAELETPELDSPEPMLTRSEAALAPPPAPSAAPRAGERSAKPSAAPQKKGRGGLRASAMGSYGGGPRRRKARAPAASPEPTPELDGRLNRFFALRMPGPREPRRGHLTAMTANELMTDGFRAPSLELGSFDVSELDDYQRSLTDFEAQPPPSRHVFAETHEGFDYAFVAGHAVSLESDGADHVIPLSRTSAEAAPRYVCVPRETRDVFRLVDVQNPLDAPLLPGPVDVYMGGKYLLTAQTEVTAPGAVLEVGLGVEQGLKVARNSRFEEQSTGLIRGSLDLTHELSVELRNNLDHDAQLEVRERLPVPRKDMEDDVKVHVDTVKPDWSPYEEKQGDLRGGFVWSIAIPPGELRTLFARYTIRIPSGQQLVGGNRRES